jgi:hypothetical protein
MSRSSTRSRATRSEQLLGLAALCSTAIGLFAATPARAASPLQLTVRTVPALEGVRFFLNGRPFSSDASGVASITVAAPATYDLTVKNPAKLKSGLRARLARWSDGGRGSDRAVTLGSSVELLAGFDVDRLVHNSFTDARGDPIDAGEIERVTVVDDSGASRSYPAVSYGVRGPAAPAWQRRPAGTRWLTSERVTSSGPLEARPVTYTAHSVLVSGATLEARPSQPYSPGSGTWTIEVDAYRTSLAGEDALFGTGVGSSVQLEYPDGRTVTAASGGRGVLLAPGSYVASSNGSGIDLSQSFSVPAADHVGPRVVSYVDIGLVLVLAALGGALLLVRRAGSAAPAAARSEPIDHGTVPEPIPTPPRREPIPTPPRREPETPEAEDRPPRRERDYVRVHMRSGRSIEGWRDSSPAGSEIVIMSVVTVRDAVGDEVMSTPLDSFLVSSQIARIEPLSQDDPSADQPVRPSLRLVTKRDDGGNAAGGEDSRNAS